ncbi:fungal-specific transcription factor domain-containing protein [Mycena floridula]|nr:fungal-specific transcription factor domain-containing protein [Mycena floridula]
MGLYPLGPNESKRRRILASCDACSRQKLACDSEKMPGRFCSNCVELGIDCSIKLRPTESPKADNSDLGILFFQGYADIRFTVAVILSPTIPFKVPTDRSNVRLTMVELARYINALETELVSRTRQSAAAEASHNQLDPSTTGTTAKDAPGHRDPFPTEDVVLAEQVKRMTLRQTAESHYFGPSSNFALTNAVLDARKHFSGNAEVPSYPRRPLYWTVNPRQLSQKPTKPLVFPEEDLLDNLIELYFIHVNPYFPLFHRPTFLRLMEHKTHLFQRDFGLTVLAVCAVASRYCTTDPRALESGLPLEDATLNIGWEWFAQVLPDITQMPSLEPVSLYEFQMYCVAIMYSHGSPIQGSAWALTGLAVRQAQDIGIHRKISAKHRTVNSELWKRAFWVLMCFDIFSSVALGRPRAANPEDYDQDLPADCDDEYWKHADPDQAFRQPPGKPSKLSYWISYLKVLHILGFAHRSIYCATKPESWLRRLREWDVNVVVDIDSALNKWIASIPEHLKWDPENPDLTFFNQSALLYTGYYYTQIIAHQRFILSRTPNDVAFPHLAICANAARSYSRLMNVQSRRGYIASMNTIVPLFSSALVLLLNHWAGRRFGLQSNPGKQYADVWNCINVLRHYEPTWHYAGRFCDVLEQLINFEGETSSTTRNILKRAPSQNLSNESGKDIFDLSDTMLWQNDPDPVFVDFTRFFGGLCH